MPAAIGLPEESGDTQNTGQPVELWMKVVSAGLTILSALIYVTIFFSGARFKDLLQGFDADLPALIRIFVVSCQYYAVLLLIGLIPCLRLLSKRSRPVYESNRLFRLVLVSFGISLLALLAFFAVAYSPIFNVRSAV